jgi:hypothetical protein
MPIVHVVRDLANQKVVTGATAGMRQLTGNEWDFCRVEVQVVVQTRHVRIDRPQRFPARWDGMTRDMGSSTWDMDGSTWDMDGSTRFMTRTPGTWITTRELPIHRVRLRATYAAAPRPGASSKGSR